MCVTFKYFFITAVLPVLGLRITRFSVPSLVVPGDSAELSCHFDLGRETLYSVKWYRNSREFFRFFPSLKPQYMAFPAPGIDIDVSRSTPSRVFLRNLTLQSEGQYTCQVSADEPYFGCVQEHRHVLVYIPPESSPRIHGDVTEYGNNLTVHCTSAKSKPAANLNWYVNDVLTHSGEVTEVIRHPDNLESSSSSLRLHLTSPHLPGDVIKVTCSASISDVITSVSEELLINKPREKVLELKNVGSPRHRTILIVIICFVLTMISQKSYG